MRFQRRARTLNRNWPRVYSNYNLAMNQAVLYPCLENLHKAKFYSNVLIFLVGEISGHHNIESVNWLLPVTHM